MTYKGAAANDTTTSVLLVLYEFEAKSRLKDPELEKVMDKALQLPQTEPKVFETLAGMMNTADASNTCQFNGLW